MPLFLIFLVVPIVEMLLLFRVADHIGGLNTVGLVVLTAVIGIQILKQQGLATFTRANRRLESGEIPGQEILEGLLLAVGGAFLLTPGFITDTVGFILLIGPSRRALAHWLIRTGRIAAFTSNRGGSMFTYTNFNDRERGGSDDPDVYEGEYTREQPPKSWLEDPDKD